MSKTCCQRTTGGLGLVAAEKMLEDEYMRILRANMCEVFSISAPEKGLSGLKVGGWVAIMAITYIYRDL